MNIYDRQNEVRENLEWDAQEEIAKIEHEAL